MRKLRFHMINYQTKIELWVNNKGNHIVKQIKKKRAKCLPEL